MILKISSDSATFQEISFGKGFNVILADITTKSTEKGSRNSLGKTTLVELIHYCLGSTGKPRIFREKIVRDWTYRLNFTIKGKEVSASRCGKPKSKIEVKADFSEWPLLGDSTLIDDMRIFSIKDWTMLLGNQMFGLELDYDKTKYKPSFRSLVSYFARSPEVAQKPFSNSESQQLYQKQIDNTFLLGLNWPFASRFEEIRNELKLVNSLRKAAKEGRLSKFAGDIGQLEAERVRTESSRDTLRKELSEFQIEPEYDRIEREADELGARIKDIKNAQSTNRQLHEMYKRSIRDEKDVPVENIVELYEEANVVLPNHIVNSLKQAKEFHEIILRNRRRYLETESERLRTDILDAESLISDLTGNRASLLRILRTRGALEQYTEVQLRLSEINQQFDEIKSRIRDLKKLEKGKSDLAIEKEKLIQDTISDIDERRSVLDRAIALFNSNSQYLYSKPGTLSIDVGKGGYQFSVKIEGSGSEGKERMATFCYDLTLLELWSKTQDAPGFLIHDSSIFADVDSRQITKALELAYKKSIELDSQYICLMNSDSVPYDSFSDEFRKKFEDSVRIRLTDSDDKGSLLGMRF
ncbi:MAG: DUF2326 domain-containing protein [Candidatus Thorarchaeota archaeon]